MAQSFEYKTLGINSFALPEGQRIRLRLAQLRDVPAAAELVDGDMSTVEVARLVKCDPRQRVSICATALVGLRETVVGFGAMEVGAEQPSVVGACSEELADLLADALIDRAEIIAEREAAA
jgi:hypothetical protein